jgi:nicotinamidase-related amidase
MQITRENSALVVIDVQSRLAPAIAGNESIVRRTEALLQAAALFGVPKLLTEHCPDRMGRVIEPLRSRFGAEEIIEKTAFAATAHSEFVERVRRLQRRCILLTGMEAHVCVLQTALGLRSHGYEVGIVVDACGSRIGRQVDREIAISRLQQAGCLITTTDTLLYEWTAAATDPRFRDVLTLVKSL